MKRFLLVLCLCITLFSTLSFADIDFDISANAAILMDTTTGQIIYEKNSNEKMYPASITKILSAIVVLEKCNLTDNVVVSENALKNMPSDSSTAKLKAGETLTVEQLLYAMLVTSGNDAANVLAEHAGGSIESFAAMMNTKAKELGAENSNFVNANGLHDDNHYVTASDMAIIAKHAMQNETFKKIVSTKTYTIPKNAIYTDGDREYKNSNLLLFPDPVPPNTKTYYYEYATGIKTGNTSKAGNTLVASAKKDNMELICILLKVPSTDNSNRYTEAKKLFTYGFNNFSLNQLPNNIPAIKDIPSAKKNAELTVEIENGGYILVSSGVDVSTLQYKITQKAGLQAPIQAGSNIGTITYEIDGKVYEYNLIAKNDLEEKSSFGEIILNGLKFIGKLILYIVIGLIFLIILIRIINKIRKKSKRKARRYKN